MERKERGVTTVFRDDEGLGDVRYDFSIDEAGRVTGSVAHVDHVALHPVAPRVPPNFLPQLITETDLHLSLSDGTVVEFLVKDTDGNIENGRRR